MKKLYYSLFVSLTLMFAASCAKEVPQSNETLSSGEGVAAVDLIPMTFEAVQDDYEGTKSNINGNFILWESSDDIAVFDGTDFNKFTVSALSGDGKNATFTGSAASASTYVAVAPFVAATNKSVENQRISVKIPGTQTIRPGHCVDSDALVSTAISNGTEDLSFTNQFSLMKVTISRNDVASITLTGNNGEALYGTNHFYYGGEGAPRMDLSNAGGTDGIVLVYKDADDVRAVFPTGDYYIVLWPTTFSKGFKMIYKNMDDERRVASVSSSQVFARNAGQDLGNPIGETGTWCPTVITTAAQLKMWRRAAGDYAAGEEVKLGADINLEGYTWTPVEQFVGVFNGQGHKIYNFTVSDDSDNRLGFIRTLGSSNGEAAVLKNVVFGSSNGTSADGSSSITMTKVGESSWQYAGLVGYAHLNTTIQNVTNFVPVSASSAVASKHALGGIVAMTNKNVTLENCVNRAPVTDNSACETTDDSALGGVVGWNDSEGLTVSGCENYGVVTNNCVGVSCIGGIMGKATCQSFKMENCSNHANITNAAASVSSGTNNWDKAIAVGGVLGRFGKNNNTNNYIDKCSNEGQICLGAETNGSYRQAFGGVIGSISYKCTVRGCSNTAKVYDNAICNSDLSMGGILGSGSSSNLLLTKAEDDTPNTNSGEIFHYKKHTNPTFFGGIVGYMSGGGTVEYGVNDGRLVSDPSGQVEAEFNAGGICGNSKGSILNCTNNGYIFAWAAKLTAYIGGICGGKSNTYRPVRVLNCKNTGYLSAYNTKGSSMTGGILSILYPSATEVRGCTNTGLITTGNFYEGGSGNTPASSITTYQKKDYYMGGLFGCVEAPTSDVTDNVTDCVVACTISNKTNADKSSNWTSLITGKTLSTSSTAYKLVFGTASNPILILNTSRIEFADMPSSSETISTNALAYKWLMGSSSSLYDATAGSSDTNKVDFHFSLVSSISAGIQ